METVSEKKIRRLEKKVAMLQEQLESYEARSGYLTAEEMLGKCNAWIANNPRAWRYLKTKARESIRYRTRFSIKRELERLRDSGLVRLTDDAYKISNSYSAVLVRLLVKEMPRLYPYVTVKKSKVDGVLDWKPESAA